MLIRNIFIVIGLFISANALAAKVAVLEVQKIFAESKQAKAYQQALEKEFAPRQQVLQGKQAQLQLEARNYEKNRLIWSDNEAKKKENEIIRLRQEYQQYGQELQQELKQAQQKNIRSIESMIEEIVEDIAKKENYDLVLFQGIAYHKKSLNITDRVLEVMNKKK